MVYDHYLIKGKVGSHSPLVCGDLEANFVPRLKDHIAFHIFLAVREEETLPTVLVGYTTLMLPSRLTAQLRGDNANHSLLTQDLMGQNYYIKDLHNT